MICSKLELITKLKKTNKKPTSFFLTIVFRKNTLFDINWVIFLKEYFILLRGMCYNLISFSPFFLSGFNFLLDVGGAGWQASIRMVFASEH